jgi:hypothetical protein
MSLAGLGEWIRSRPGGLYARDAKILPLVAAYSMFAPLDPLDRSCRRLADHAWHIFMYQITSPGARLGVERE